MKRIHQYEPDITPADIYAVVSQLKTGRVGPGARVVELEGFLQEMSLRIHAHVVSSGTMALYAAIQALVGMEEGVTVYFPAYTFLAGANAALMCNHYNVVLVDVDPNTYCMSLDDLKRQYSYHQEDFYNERSMKYYGKHLVIYVAHNNYNAGDQLYNLLDFCDEHHIYTIVDGAQSMGNADILSRGMISTLSFSVPKLVTGGQGGAVMTNDPELSTKLSGVIDHGGGDWRKSKIHIGPGLNLRMSDLNAALIMSQCSRLGSLLGGRATIWGWYADCLREKEFKGKLLGAGFSESPWMMVYKVDDAERIGELLRGQGINAHTYYKPMFCNDYFEYDASEFPNAERAGYELLYLPSSLNLAKDQIKFICQSLFDAERCLL